MNTILKYFCLINMGVLACYSLQADVLIFQDTFNAADNSNLNADLTRQSGSSATQTYDEFGSYGTGLGNGSISSDQLSLIRSTGNEYNAELNLDFGSVAALTTGGSFKVKFDVLTIGSTFSGFAFNGAQNQDRPVVDDTTDFGILFLGSGHAAAGEISVREGEPEKSRATPLFNLTGEIELSVYTTGISTGNGFTVDMTIDGDIVDLDDSSAATAFSGTWSTNSLYMSFNSLGSGTIDNFAVIAIPEPSTVLYMLTGMSLLGLGVLRKRSK